MDIIYDTDGDILINSTGLVFSDGDAQNLERLLMLSQGDLKLSPLTGCNITRLINGRIDSQEVIRDIKVQLEADNWKNEKVVITKQNIQVDAVR